MRAPIYALPLDIVELISQLLDAHSIAMLYLTGDPHIKFVLSNGGVLSFRMEALGYWPALVSCFRLSALHLSTWKSLDSPYFFNKGLDLSILPRSLETLVLDVPDAFLGVARLGEPILAQLFPSLTTLKFAKETYAANFSQQAFMEGLPPSLLTLRLPSSYHVDVANMLRLPCNLLSLTITIADASTRNYAQIKHAAVFSRIEKFSPRLSDYAEWPLLVPPSVKYLKISSYTMCSSAAASRMYSSLDNFNPSKEQLLSLPPHLLSFKSSHTYSEKCLINVLQCLPKTVTSLSCMSEGDDVFSPTLLPRSLTEYSSSAVRLYSKQDLLALPLNLRNWKGLLFGPTMPFEDAVLPAALESITVMRLDDTHIHVLPSRLQYLNTRATATLTMTGLAALRDKCIALKSMRLFLKASFDMGQLLLLPRTLESLALAIANPVNLNANTNFAWPASLTDLKLMMKEVAPPTSFWTSLPPLLTALSVNASILGLPRNLAFLPRGLVTLTIYAKGSNDDARFESCAAIDSFFLGGPSTLRSLQLDGWPIVNLTTECLTYLPRVLDLLRVDIAFTKMPNSFVADFMTFPGLDAPNGINRLHDFFNKLPPYIQIRSNVKTLNFEAELTEWQTARLHAAFPSCFVPSQPTSSWS